MKNESNRAGAQVKFACAAIKTIAFIVQLTTAQERRLRHYGACALALASTGAMAQQTEAQCEAISPSAYVSGLTDGAWGGFPGTGKTYFYRSACYMDLVRSTGRVELCPKVIQRRSLLGDGSAYSPAACERVAAQFKAAQLQAQREALAHAQALQAAPPDQL